MTIEEFMSPEFQVDLTQQLKESRETSELEQDRFYRELGEEIERHPIASAYPVRRI